MISHQTYNFQLYLVIVCVLCTLLIIYPATYTAFHSLKAKMIPLAVLSFVILLATLFWTLTQISIYLILGQIYNRNNTNFDNNLNVYLLSISTILFGICYNISQLTFATKYWSLSVRLKQILNNKDLIDIKPWQKCLIVILYVVNILAAITIGIATYMFMTSFDD